MGLYWCVWPFFCPSFFREDSATGFTIYKHKNEAEVEKEVRYPQCATMLQTPPDPHPHLVRYSRKKHLLFFFKILQQNVRMSALPLRAR